MLDLFLRSVALSSGIAIGIVIVVLGISVIGTIIDLKKEEKRREKFKQRQREE